jgi:hypothetical protein
VFLVYESRYYFSTEAVTRREPEENDTYWRPAEASLLALSFTVLLNDRDCAVLVADTASGSVLAATAERKEKTHAFPTRNSPVKLHHRCFGLAGMVATSKPQFKKVSHGVDLGLDSRTVCVGIVFNWRR